MNDWDYTRHARSEAEGWGNSVLYWVRDNDAKEAGRRARLAARWGLKLLGREDR